ncbi:MAG: hypothetical protein K2Y40_12625 [Reyranella sp.]|nr:hypothetical protein [Reyranella sp.]
MVEYLKPTLPVAATPRLLEQIRGHALERPIVPAGLAPFMRLPDPEPRTLRRARMAAEIARAVSSNGCVTRDDLTAAGFTDAEIAEHFTEAKRIARVAGMAI